MIGVNPKINNMITGYEAAKHDLIMISDSGIKSRSPRPVFSLKWVYSVLSTYEPCHEETRFLPMRKQTRRPAVQ